MSKKKSGGLPKDNLFRRTEVPEEPAQEVEEAVAETEETVAEATEDVAEDAAAQKRKSKTRTKKVRKSRSKHVDSETAPVADEKLKTTELPRQTYYVPAELHKQLRLLALQEEMNVSDLVVEGIGWVLGKYGK